MIALWVINPCLGNTGFYKFLTSPIVAPLMNPVIIGLWFR